MKVQRVRLPEAERVTYLVLDDDYRPIEPILSYLKFLHDLDRSPNTIRACAHHLKLFWEYLRDTRLDWTQVDIAQLAAFISWLRRPEPAAFSLEPQQARRTNATIDQMLGSVHGLYDFHIRMDTIPELPLYRFLTLPNRRYKPFLHGIAKSKSMQTRIVSVKREQRRAKTLTHKEVQALLEACTHIRDRFLLTLMYDTGMRIGHYIGWFVNAVNPFTQHSREPEARAMPPLTWVGERCAPRATWSCIDDLFRSPVALALRVYPPSQGSGLAASLAPRPWHGQRFSPSTEPQAPKDA
jgi:hypothetical protein